MQRQAQAAQHLRVLRLESQHPRETIDRLLMLASILRRPRLLPRDRQQLRPQRLRPPQRLQRRPVATQRQVRVPQRHPRIHERRSQRRRALERLRRRRQLPPLPQRQPQVVVRLHQTRLEPHCLAAMLHRLVPTPTIPQQSRQSPSQLRASGLRLAPRLVRPQCFLTPAQRLQAAPQHQVHLGRHRSRSQRPLRRHHRLLEPLRLALEHAQRPEQPRIRLALLSLTLQQRQRLLYPPAARPRQRLHHRIAWWNRGTEAGHGF